jgi:hypothetical protein
MSQSASRRKKSQHGPQQWLVQRPLTTLEIRARALKLQKAALIEMGFIAAPVPKQPTKWDWCDMSNLDPDKHRSGIVEAHTKGEARAAVKKALGLSKNKRLPDDILMEKARVIDE